MKTPNSLQKFIIILFVLAVVLPLAGCGRKSAPEQPPDSEYPREYPTR